MNNRKCHLAALVYLLAAMGGTAQNIPGIDPEHLCRVALTNRSKLFLKKIRRHWNGIRFLAGHGSSGASGSLCNSVVFHIFGVDFNGATINDEIIKDALRKTNEDFQGVTTNTGDDNPDFNMRQANMNITFKLAEKGPQGEATTGILYHRLESGFGNYYAPVWLCMHGIIINI